MALPRQALEITVQREQAGGPEAELPFIADHAEARAAIEGRNQFRDIDLAGFVHDDEVEQLQLEGKDGAQVLDLRRPERQGRQGVRHLGGGEDRFEPRRLTEEEDLLEALQVAKVLGCAG